MICIYMTMRLTSMSTILVLLLRLRATKRGASLDISVCLYAMQKALASMLLSETINF